MKKYLVVLSVLLSSLVLAGCGGRGSYGEKMDKKMAKIDAMQNSGYESKNEEAIAAFYEGALTVNEVTTPSEALTPYLADGFTSYASADTTVDKKNAAELIGQLEFLWKMVPDMTWDVQEVIQNGNKYVVRSRATGSPVGDFFGVPTDGTKTFDIQTIDIHTLNDGKITETYHVEDRASALQQLAPAQEQEETGNEDAGDETMQVVSTFMEAMGEGDMDTMVNLMDDDMIWENAGDKALPWIGPWNGKDAILNDFMPVFGSNLETTLWETEDTLVNDDTVAMFGRMNGKMTKNNEEIGEFTFGLRVKVKDGKIVLWNWLEDSYAFSQAYNASKDEE